MIALQITDIGHFMNSLLKDGLFDHFLLQEATVTQAVSYTIDGTVTPDFFDAEEIEAMNLSGMRFMPFGKIRPICFELMKGKKKPTYFKFVFLLSPKNQQSTIEKSGSGFHTEDISAMYINLTYKNNILVCTTGISYKLFSLDKTLEQEWDRLVTLFLKQNGISHEEAE